MKQNCSPEFVECVCSPHVFPCSVNTAAAALASPAPIPNSISFFAIASLTALLLHRPTACGRWRRGRRNEKPAKGRAGSSVVCRNRQWCVVETLLTTTPLSARKVYFVKSCPHAIIFLNDYNELFFDPCLALHLFSIHSMQVHVYSNEHIDFTRLLALYCKKPTRFQVDTDTVGFIAHIHSASVVPCRWWLGHAAITETACNCLDMVAPFPVGLSLEQPLGVSC